MDKANRLLPCGHSCVLGKPIGMAPNGPCRCLDGLRPEIRTEVRRQLLEARTPQPPAYNGEPPLSREEFIQLADYLAGDANNPEKALGELYDQLQAQFVAASGQPPAQFEVECAENLINNINGYCIDRDGAVDDMPQAVSLLQAYVASHNAQANDVIDELVEAMERARRTLNSIAREEGISDGDTVVAIDEALNRARAYTVKAAE